MIADRLTRARLRAGYKSQKEFATALRVSRGLVGQWETGLKLPGRANLVKISNLCAVSMAYLMGGTDDPFRPITTTDPYEIEMILKFRRCDPEFAHSLVGLLTELMLR
jgi:transcriptional regulator with XRE-family HTH domain